MSYRYSMITTAIKIKNAQKKMRRIKIPLIVHGLK